MKQRLYFMIYLASRFSRYISSAVFSGVIDILVFLEPVFCNLGLLGDLLSLRLFVRDRERFLLDLERDLELDDDLEYLPSLRRASRLSRFLRSL